MLSLGQVAWDRAWTANFDLNSSLSRVGSASCAAIVNRHWKVVFLCGSWTDSSNELCSAGNRFAADCLKRSSLLWMRRSRCRGRPPSCRRHHQGVAGQDNISDLNQITDIDWEEQTYSMHLISSWESLPSSTWPPLGCYLISALGSTSSSAPLQVHLGRGDLPLTTVITLYCFSNLLFADIPYPPDYNVLISWIQEWSLL